MGVVDSHGDIYIYRERERERLIDNTWAKLAPFTGAGSDCNQLMIESYGNVRRLE